MRACIATMAAVSAAAAAAAASAAAAVAVKQQLVGVGICGKQHFCSTKLDPHAAGVGDYGTKLFSSEAARH